MVIFVRGLMDTEDNFLHGEMSIVGRLVDASNATLLVEYANGLRAIYKPTAGERPLWDFPDGNLASREVASYYISEVGGFNLVPRTILRDGPYGMGSVQEWIDVPDSFDSVEYGQQDLPELRSLALFDAVINNTDRKFGHILQDENGRLFACDHGVTLHVEDKLRTVLWRWSGDHLDDAEISLLQSLKSSIDDEYLTTLITKDEIFALRARIERLCSDGTMPMPSEEWPAVPWPPY